MYWHCMCVVYVRAAMPTPCIGRPGSFAVCVRVCAFRLALELRYKDIMN